MQFAVVGTGVIGHLRALTVSTQPQTTLAAVVDTNRESAERAAILTGARALTDIRDVLAEPRIDAVIISTPVQLHEEMVVAALEADKHVLCEKPLSNTLEGCRRMLDIARARGKTLAVGFNHRYYPCVKFFKERLDAGAIGELDHLRVYGGHEGLANFRADWMYQGAVSGGGAMMDVGIHMTDLTRFVLGELTEVYGVAAGRIWNVAQSEDNAMAIFKSAAGIPAIYQASWTEWKGYRWYVEAYGDRGMIRASYAPMFNLLVTQDRPGGRRKRSFKLYPEIILRERLKSWQSTTLATFHEELTDFLRMVAGDHVPLADGWSGYRAVEIAQAVYESSASGLPVRLSAPAV